MGGRTTEPSLLEWRRKALAAGDEREIAQTEELLRNCSEEEGLRIADWVSRRLRRTAYGLYACEAATIGVAASIIVPLTIRHPESHWSHFLIHGLLGLVLAYFVAIWLTRSNVAKELRRSVDVLRFIPYPAVRATLLSISQPGCLQKLVDRDSELVALVEKDRSEATAPAMDSRALNVWLRHIRRGFSSSGPANKILFAETILREAGHFSKSLIAYRIVDSLADKDPGNAEQECIVRAAKTAAELMRPRFPEHG